ncbi:hypothetical protein HRbin36_02367 [bacterium HR36]|nr:hypothetical protein HRbin36_02367 [bacterium HR36]
MCGNSVDAADVRINLAGNGDAGWPQGSPGKRIERETGGRSGTVLKSFDTRMEVALLPTPGPVFWPSHFRARDIGPSSKPAAAEPAKHELPPDAVVLVGETGFLPKTASIGNHLCSGGQG